MATKTLTATGFCEGGLITADEYYAFANLTSPGNAVQIQNAINAASDYIRRHTGRQFVLTSDDVTIVEIFSGIGDEIYYPKHAPILNVTSVHYWNVDTWTAVDSTYTPATDGEYVNFVEGYEFYRGARNWKVTYTIGYDSFPQDLKFAVCAITQLLLGGTRDNPHISSQSDAEQSFTYFNTSNLKLPGHIEDIIARYVRYSG
jgi:hypothetical protein